MGVWAAWAVLQHNQPWRSLGKGCHPSFPAALHHLVGTEECSLLSVYCLSYPQNRAVFLNTTFPSVQSIFCTKGVLKPWSSVPLFQLLGGSKEARQESGRETQMGKLKSMHHHPSWPAGTGRWGGIMMLRDDNQRVAALQSCLTLRARP